jgi:hypothetical protein
MFCSVLSLDDIWNFGFSYNIASGLIPYRDFNMVVTPFFPMLMSIFLLIFSKQLIVMYIAHSAVVVGIMYLIKKFCKNSYYLIFILILLIMSVNYSVFCFFLLLILIYCEINHKNDYLIGVLLAITVLSKQNIGVALLIPTILFIRNKQLLKRFIGFIIPIILFIIYLLVTNSFAGFINYTVLGLFSFAGDNTLVSPWMFIEILIIIYLTYKYLHNKKDIFLLYVLCFQIITFPIFDVYHFMLGITAIIVYILKDFKLNRSIVQIASALMIILLFTAEIATIDFDNVSFPNNTVTMKYRIIDKSIIKQLNQISDYIKKNKDKDIYLFTYLAYPIKLESNIKINQYDLINNGNLGVNGVNKVIDKIKQADKNTLFIINESKYLNIGQINKKILKYVTDNLHKKEKVDIFSIYTK